MNAVKDVPTRASPPAPRRWKIGSQVVSLEEVGAPWATRLVVGHKPDGRCMTVFLHPPPWLKRSGVYLEDPWAFEEVATIAGSTP
jgi:hypothetical protein